MGDGPHPDPPSTRGNTYRRIGVRACRRLHTVRKLTSANGSRLTFCGRQNSKCKISWQRGNALEGEERIGVPPGGGSKYTFAISGPDVRFEEEGGTYRKRFQNVWDFFTRLPSRENEIRTLRLLQHSNTPTLPYADTPTRRHADTFFLPPIRSPAAAT
jgi:hypothetical protein